MSLSVCFDYLQGVCSFDTLFDVTSFLDYVCSLLPMGDSVYYPGYRLKIGLVSYNCFRSLNGKLYGGISFSNSTRQYLVYLQMPGSYCSQLGEDLLHLCKFLINADFNFTRCDIALDDYSRRVSFDEVDHVGECGHYRLVQHYELIKSKVNKSSPSVHTCYFGCSDKKLRFYNAQVVHGIEADRWELQLGSSHAPCVVSEFIEDQLCLSSFLFGAVDFGLIGQNWYQFDRFDWWQSLIDEGGFPRKVKLIYPDPCFQRSLDWLYSQVAPTLAVAFYGYGDNEFNSLISDLIKSGSSRFKDYHHKLITEVKKEGSFNVI